MRYLWSVYNFLLILSAFRAYSEEFISGAEICRVAAPHCAPDCTHNCCRNTPQSRGGGEGVCSRVRDALKRLPSTDDRFAVDMWLPECEQLDGAFRATQRKGGKVICLARDGAKLFGQSEPASPHPMKCGCSRRLGRPQEERCSPSGDFATLQCLDQLCYCASAESGRLQSRVVKRAYAHLLPCYSEDFELEGGCAREVQRLRRHTEEFARKNLHVIGLGQLLCDPDGSFAPTQCDVLHCVCTDRAGVGIESYFREVESSDIKRMLCNCPRSTAALKCRSDGTFVPSQCFGESCFCVDEDGDIISRAFNTSVPLDCTELHGKWRKIWNGEEGTVIEDPDYY